MGHNYYYLSDYEAIDVGYPYGSIIYKAESEYHFKQIVVFSDITDIHQTGDFIIVKQTPNLELYKKYISDNAKLRNNGIPNLFMNDINYYIINQISDKVSEPLHEETLKLECRKNNIDISFITDKKW